MDTTAAVSAVHNWEDQIAALMGRHERTWVDGANVGKLGGGVRGRGALHRLTAGAGWSLDTTAQSISIVCQLPGEAMHARGK